MSSDKFRLDDYIDVAERLVDFHGRYPEGSLQTVSWSAETVDGKVFIVYRAAAYRNPDDPRPGHGTAWEPFPGATSFTKNSELMNAETAAWGRAILACGLPAKRGLASLQEVRNRAAEQETDPKPSSRDKPRSKATAPPPPARSPDAAKSGPSDSTLVTPDQLKQLRATFDASGQTDEQLCWFLLSVGVESLPENPDKAAIGTAMRGLTLEQAFKLDALLKGEDESIPTSGEAAKDA